MEIPTTLKAGDGYGETLPTNKPISRALEIPTTLKAGDGYGETLPAKKTESRDLEIPTTQKTGGNYGETLNEIKLDNSNSAKVMALEMPSGGKVLQLQPIKTGGKQGETLQLGKLVLYTRTRNVNSKK